MIFGNEEFRKLTPKCQLQLYRITRQVTNGELTPRTALERAGWLLEGQKVNAQRSQADIESVREYLTSWLRRRLG